MRTKIFFFWGVLASTLGASQNITPNFSSAGTCGNMCFTDQSTSTNGPVVGWNWSFPGGSPATSTSQNPCVTYPPGIYNVTLSVTNSNGDGGSIYKVVTVGGFPTAAVVPTTPCLGQATTLLDGSIAVSGDPIASWNWSMPGGTPNSSSSQNTSTLYSTAGVHTVTLIVTSQAGCKDTVVQQVIVYNPPVANFSAFPFSGAMAFTDLTTSQDGTISSWNWSFPGGTPSSSAMNNPSNIVFPPGTYTACLTVTTNYGCVDSTCQTFSVLGVAENYLSLSINISPSFSSSGIFTISVLNPQVNVEGLEVYDVAGRKLRELSVSKAIIALDLSVEKNGIYFVKIKTDYGDLTKKIILIR